MRNAHYLLLYLLNKSSAICAYPHYANLRVLVPKSKTHPATHTHFELFSMSKFEYSNFKSITKTVRSKTSNIHHNEISIFLRLSFIIFRLLKLKQNRFSIKFATHILRIHFDLTTGSVWKKIYFMREEKSKTSINRLAQGKKVHRQKIYRADWHNKETGSP